MSSAYLFDPLGRLVQIDARNSGLDTTIDHDGDMAIGGREPAGTRPTTRRAYVLGADALPVAVYHYYNGAYETRYW